MSSVVLEHVASLVKSAVRCLIYLEHSQVRFCYSMSGDVVIIVGPVPVIVSDSAGVNLIIDCFNP